MFPKQSEDKLLLIFLGLRAILQSSAILFNPYLILSVPNVNELSCHLGLPSSWYGKSFRRVPVWWSQTSTKPSTEPETQNWPSGEKVTHSGWDFSPNFTSSSRDKCIQVRQV